ncbi:MAG: metallophosphoesterase [Anaerolineales bacterium]|nr:metallophosphoesterase [Anaerolineales bacterium]
MHNDNPISNSSIRVLLVADTHLGIDLPFRPRDERRRRGHDFFDNLNRALLPALDDRVDLVVHGGDLFYRTRVPAVLVEMAMAPLIKVADHGIPVYIVPGNHERSRIPLHLWTQHPNLYIFNKPRTFVQTIRGVVVALAGFPFAHQVRDRFGSLVEQTGYRETASDVRLLCLHQTIEGATVGPSGYTFRGGAEVIRGQDIPRGIAAVLAGHIHRQQTLTRDLRGNSLPAPVIYPGSIERTSFAERNEEKGYTIFKVEPSEHPGGRLADNEFIPLPTRPMETIHIQVDGKNNQDLTDYLLGAFKSMDSNAIVRIVPQGPLTNEQWQVFNATHVRTLAPPTMNVQVATNRPQRNYRTMPPKAR